MHVNKQRSLKWAFRTFFEGWDDPLDELGSSGTTPVVDIPITRFEISQIECFDFDECIVLRLSLNRPGLLIGKGGQTIDAVQKYLSEREDKPVKIYIIEKDIWK